MVFLRSSFVGLSLLVAACSGTSRSARSTSGVIPALPNEVVTQVDLSMLPHLEGRLDAASHAATAVVLGLRRIEDPCGTYIDVRLFPEVHLGGRDPSEPFEDEEFVELRALLAPTNSKVECGEPRARTIETNHISVGDRVVVALGDPNGVTNETPKWKRKARILALAPIQAMPTIAAVMPAMQLPGEDEQYLPIPRMPSFGTPESVRLMGKKPRFDGQGDKIIDRAQGIVWQREQAKYKMSIQEAGLYCQTQRTGGHDDWRLPTAFEMHGLFLPSIPRPSVVDAKLFPAEKDELYWTRTDDDGAWVGLPYEGILISTHYDDPSPYGNYNVRCVRPGQMLATEMVDRFGSKDGLLLDSASGLSWHLGSQRAGVTRALAQDYCDQGTFGGYTDWRLPSPEEAFSIMSICPEAIANWEGEADDVWTSMIDPEAKVGGTFRPCNLYRSVPLAAIFEKEGIDPKNPLARVMCTRNTEHDFPSEPPACGVGSKLTNTPNFAICEEKGVRHGSYRSSWPSGGIFEKATYDHGLRQGLFVMYHENGALYSRGDHVKGKLAADVWAKRPTGALIFKGSYKNGLPFGRWTFFDQQGREVEFIEMVDGKPGLGQYVRYDDNGEKLIQVPTLGGWEHGLGRTFHHDSGQVSSEFTYRAGWLEGPTRTIGQGKAGQTGQNVRDEMHGAWIRINVDGKVTDRWFFSNGKLDGVQESFDAKGTLISSRRYRAGARLGTWETKSSEGSVQERGEIDEFGTGTITAYSNGKRQREEHYLRGKKHGTWRSYHDSQQKEREEEYRDGYLVQSTSCYEDGKIRGKLTYLEGKAHGLAEHYDMSGRILSRGNYQHGLREGQWEFTTPIGRHFEAEFVKGKAVKLTEGKGGR